MKPAGTVTISLDDYHKLIELQEKADALTASTKRAAKELAVFLSFMTSRSDIEPHVSEFNKQSIINSSNSSTLSVTNLVFIIRELYSRSSIF